jgi:hypothetical protein
MYFLAGFFFLISPGFGPNSGFWCCVFLTIRKTQLYIRVIRKASLSSPPIPFFNGIHKGKTFLVNLSMKCWYSAFNAQGSRLIIVVVQLGAVKIYVATVEALKKKERQDKIQFTTKIDGFLSFIPPWMLMCVCVCVFFACVFLNLTLCMTKLRVLVLCFSYFRRDSIRPDFIKMPIANQFKFHM